VPLFNTTLYDFLVYLYVTVLLPSANIVTVCVAGLVNPVYVFTPGVTVAPISPFITCVSDSTVLYVPFNCSC